MRKIEVTTAFRRDFKRESRGRYQAVLNTDVPRIIDSLARDVPLAARHRDHALTGNWSSYRDRHIKPDLVLIYRLLDGDGTEESPALLVLARLGSHAELGL